MEQTSDVSDTQYDEGLYQDAQLYPLVFKYKYLNRHNRVA